VESPPPSAQGDGAATVSHDGHGGLEDLIAALAEENAQLQHALDSRVVIEQAKGVLSERFGTDVVEAFELLRRAARDNRVRLHDLASRVVSSRVTPPEIDGARLGGRRARA
jgi:ANTAR domain-containing protein